MRPFWLLEVLLAVFYTVAVLAAIFSLAALALD